MAQATHATLATFHIDLSREEEQRRSVQQVIIPGFRQFPGFVCGHWTLDRAASESLVVITYESRESAESMADNIRGNAANQRAAGLGLLSIRVLEVVASA